MMNIVFRFARFLLIFAIVAGFSFWLYGSLFLDQSYKGYVNGKIIHIRTPIQGKLTLNAMQVGKPVHSGEVVASVENERAYELLSLQQGLSQKVQVNEQTLASLESQIANREAWLARFGQEAKAQTTLRVSYEKDQLAALQSEVSKLEAVLEKSNRDADRYLSLAQKGYAPMAVAEQYVIKAQEADAALKAQLAKLKAERSKIAAAEAGIQVDGSLTKGYSDARRYEVESELFRLRNERDRLLAEMVSSEQQGYTLGQSISTLRNSKIATPVSGVVWNINAYSNEFISAQQSTVEVLDCDNLWVDTFVQEKQLNAIDTSAPVDVKLLSRPELGVMKGHVQLVRSGVGRVTVQEGAAIPNTNEKAQALIRVKVDWKEQPDPNSSCYVGSSVKAVFRKRPFNMQKPLENMTFFAAIF